MPLFANSCVLGRLLDEDKLCLLQQLTGQAETKVVGNLFQVTTEQLLSVEEETS